MCRLIPSALLAALACCRSLYPAEPTPQGPADLIIHHGRVVTVDPKFRIAEAVAVKDGRILAVGKDDEIVKLKGPKTQLIDAETHTVLPGLYDSHVHPMGAALSEVSAPLPTIRSIKDVLDYFRKEAARKPEGEWIVLRFTFPTRLDEARFPTKAELDEAAPRHPVMYHAGPACMVNSMALKVSGVTKDTPSPSTGMVVKDAKGEPTGMLRNAYRVLKGVPGEGDKLTTEQKRAALLKMLHLYNAQGLTSIADRNASRDNLDYYLDLKKSGELTLRVNVARSFDSSGNREQVVKRFEELPGKDGLGGPTGVGDDWVRIGPIKLFLDGGMLNGTAYMRRPWPKGATYQILEDDYRGLLFIQPDQLQMVVEEGAKRRWQMTAHTAGEGAMDNLLDAFDVEAWYVENTLGSSYLASGVEMAMWDLIGQATKQPLYKLLGGAIRKKIELAACMGIRPYHEAKEIARQYLDMGFTTLKTKAGRDAKEDLDMVGGIRDGVGDKLKLRIDPNQGYSPAVAFPLARDLEKFNLEYFEQPMPLSLIGEAARLRRFTRTPIALNESVTTPEVVLQILKLDAAAVLLPDTYQCAGILGVKKVAALADAAGVPCVFHCAHDLGLKTAAMLHVVASSPGFTLANDCTYYGLVDDIITPTHRIERGTMQVPEGPGLGVTVDEQKLAKYRI